MKVVRDMIAGGETGLEYLDDRVNEIAKWGILRELGKWPAADIPELARYVCQEQKKDHRTIRHWEVILRKARLSETVSDI